MVLKLNETIYKAFPSERTARIIDQMPLLIEQGRIPMSVSDLMKRRLEVVYSQDEKLKKAYWNNYFDTGDAVARHPDGRVKIVLDSQDLREINPESKLLKGGLILTDEQYRKLDGPEFEPNDFDRYTGKSLTQDQVNDNPMWLALARDPVLLREYTDKTFEKAKAQFNYDENMGLYVPSVQEQPIMRSWYVGRLGSWSSAGGGSLGDAGSRLVGVAPEALVVAKNLETKL